MYKGRRDSDNLSLFRPNYLQVQAALALERSVAETARVLVGAARLRPYCEMDDTAKVSMRHG